MTGGLEIGAEGGLIDMPRDELPLSDSASTAPQIKLQVGDIVKSGDHDNIGEVILVEDGRVQVRFTNKHTGREAELFLPVRALELVRRQAAVKEFNVLTYEQLLELPPNRWLVKNVLRQGELAALFGPPGLLKTFIALGLALETAVGLDWWGHTTSRGRVCYIAAEGLYSIRERAIAWTQQFTDRDRIDSALQEAFFVLGEAVSFLEPEFENFLEVVGKQESNFSLIVVDTLARCMAGGDENSAEDMGLLVRACDRLRKLTGATVLLVHHSGKADEASERGSSALRGACDTMLKVVRGSREGVVRLVCDKQKEGAPFAPIDLELEIVEVGVESDGSARTSGRLKAGTPAQQGAVRGTSDGLEDPAVTIQKTLAEGFFEDGAAGTPLLEACKLKRATYYRHRKNLVDAAILERFTAHGHERYRLTAKSEYYEPPPAPTQAAGGEVSVSVSQVSATSSETPTPVVSQSQSQSHNTPLGGVTVRRDGDLGIPPPQQGTNSDDAAPTDPGAPIRSTLATLFRGTASAGALAKASGLKSNAFYAALTREVAERRVETVGKGHVTRYRLTPSAPEYVKPSEAEATPTPQPKKRKRRARKNRAKPEVAP
jgi:hypothetical protein